MSILDTARLTLRHFWQSVHTQYGKGAYNFLRFAYYSFLRVNTFAVLVCDYYDIPISSEKESRLRIIRHGLEELYHLRHFKNLPREFYCDMTFGVKDFFIGIWDDTPAYIHWVFPAGSKSRFLYMGNGCAEINYMLTFPEFRRRGICSQVIRHTLHQLVTEGVRRIFCVVNVQNIASIKAVQRAGFKELKRVKSIGPFNARLGVTAP